MSKKFLVDPRSHDIHRLVYVIPSTSGEENQVQFSFDQKTPACSHHHDLETITTHIENKKKEAPLCASCQSNAQLLVNAVFQPTKNRSEEITDGKRKQMLRYDVHFFPRSGNYDNDYKIFNRTHLSELGVHVPFLRETYEQFVSYLQGGVIILANDPNDPNRVDRYQRPGYKYTEYGFHYILGYETDEKTQKKRYINASALIIMTNEIGSFVKTDQTKTYGVPIPFFLGEDPQGAKSNLCDMILRYFESQYIDSILLLHWSKKDIVSFYPEFSWFVSVYKLKHTLPFSIFLRTLPSQVVKSDTILHYRNGEKDFSFEIDPTRSVMSPLPQLTQELKREGNNVEIYYNIQSKFDTHNQDPFLKDVGYSKLGSTFHTMRFISDQVYLTKYKPQPWDSSQDYDESKIEKHNKREKERKKEHEQNALRELGKHCLEKAQRLNIVGKDAKEEQEFAKTFFELFHGKNLDDYQKTYLEENLDDDDDPIDTYIILLFKRDDKRTYHLVGKNSCLVTYTNDTVKSYHGYFQISKVPGAAGSGGCRYLAYAFYQWLIRKKKSHRSLEIKTASIVGYQGVRCYIAAAFDCGLKVEYEDVEKDRIVIDKDTNLNLIMRQLLISDNYYFTMD
jgi:hypothetical protein